jgi:hypothetical protein
MVCRREHELKGDFFLSHASPPPAICAGKKPAIEKEVRLIEPSATVPTLEHG